MKTAKGFRIGPGMASLMMILVTLLMAALAVMAMASAKNDATLSERNLETTRAYYDAAARIQRELAEIDIRLYEARREAAGDPDAYARLVRGIQADYPGGDDEGLRGTVLRVIAPMNGDSHLEASLLAPFTLTGLRFALLGHKLVNDAPWEAADEWNLFTE